MPKSVTIEEINDRVKNGEKFKVKSFDGTQEIWVDVVTVHDHGTLDLVEVELEDGKKIKCTIDHKFRTTEGMLPLYEILDKELEIVVENK